MLRMKECDLCHHTTSNNLNHFVLINVNCLAPSHLLFIGDRNLICLHTIVGVRNAQCASAVQVCRPTSPSARSLPPIKMSTLQ